MRPCTLPVSVNAKESGIYSVAEFESFRQYGKRDEDGMLRIFNAMVHFLGVEKPKGLLIEFLNLYEAVDKYCGWVFDDDKKKKYIIEIILNMCNEHGLILREKQLRTPKRAAQCLPCYGFSLSLFTTEIKNLYRLYLRWLISIRNMGGKEVYDKYEILLNNSVLHQYLEQVGADRFNDGDIEKDAGLTAYEVAYACGKTQPFTLVQPVNGALNKYEKVTMAGSPLMTAKWEMLTMFTVNIEQYGSIDRCKQCGREYVKHHANRQLCDLCRTNAAKLKAHRNRHKAKKEGAINGKETRQQ